MIKEELYIHRCLQLAALGKGKVAPNPMVGAVLVYNDRIIGEGYHQQYGEAHAEVNCINSVSEQNKYLIAESELYVSLEPCTHYGKTPPCADFILQHQIKKIYIGCLDPFEKVDGKGIGKLTMAGCEVVTGILEDQCKQLNKRFFTFQKKKRPYIILKWAQTANGFIGTNSSERLIISNQYTQRLVHQWRSEEMAIMVGTNTAVIDNPQLNVRYAKGENPIRLVIDKKLCIPYNHKVVDKTQPTIVFNYLKQAIEDNLQYVQVMEQEKLLPQILRWCYTNNIQSILVEGGRHLLQTFIEANLWEEARVITHSSKTIKEGVKAPTIDNARLQSTEFIEDNRIDYFQPLY